MMKWFRFNPTIKETNKYLSKTVDELTKKHGGVSNEDFERELVDLTGIGWKQVKNYKNNPKPSSRLKDNSIVIKYVLKCRQNDTLRKIRSYSLITVSFLSVVFLTYWIISTPKEVETFQVHEVPLPTPLPINPKIETKVFLEIRDLLLRVGPREHSKLSLAKFTCSKLPTVQLKNCSFYDGPFQIVLIMDGDFIKKYTVMTLDSSEILKIQKQLGDRVDHSLTTTNPKPLYQQQFKVGHETVDIITSPAAPGSVAMFSVSVSLN